jgi:tetratricopeptide (TPR) repeat protein
MARRIVVALVLGVAVTGSVLLWRRTREPKRSKYVLINRTSDHDFDLAFRMSLKLAEKKSGIENALVLLPVLPPGKTIEETAAELFSKLRIGARRNGRGILYIYSAKENVLKIEVSYALEGDITDLYSHRMEEAAKTYMLSEVPQDFLSELIITTNLRGMGSKSGAEPMGRPEWLNAEFLSGGAGALVQGYSRTLEDYTRAIQHLPDAQLSQFRPSTDARTTVQRYLRSLALGAGDPRLPLLTEGSRIFRAVVPRDEAQQKRIFAFFQAAAPSRLLYAHDLALVVPQPGESNLPIVLRRGTDGLWYVDEPKAWTLFHRFEDDVNFFVKYADNPFFPELRALRMPLMERAIYDDHVGTPAPPAYPLVLAQALKALDDRIRAAPNDAANYAALGDLYLFEMNWITKAITWYEKAEALAPSELTYHWRLMDLYLNDSRADKMLAELRLLSEHLPTDTQTRAWYEYYKKEYDFSN